MALVTLLPAALVFRARFRAFAAARVILAIAFVASLPALGFLGLGVFDTHAPLPDRIAAALTIGAAAGGLLGFMGPETSGGCTQWAGILVVAHTSRLALVAGRAAWANDAREMIASGAAALGELGAAVLVALALFQLLAAMLGRRARQVDVHQIIGAGAPARGGGEREE
jgi:hypothetical protein